MLLAVGPSRLVAAGVLESIDDGIASGAEVCCLMSALTGAPIRQDLEHRLVFIAGRVHRVHTAVCLQPRASLRFCHLGMVPHNALDLVLRSQNHRYALMQVLGNDLHDSLTTGRTRPASH